MLCVCVCVCVCEEDIKRECVGGAQVCVSMCVDVCVCKYNSERERECLVLSNWSSRSSFKKSGGFMPTIRFYNKFRFHQMTSQWMLKTNMMTSDANECNNISTSWNKNITTSTPTETLEEKNTFFWLTLCQTKIAFRCTLSSTEFATNQFIFSISKIDFFFLNNLFINTGYGNTMIIQ